MLQRAWPTGSAHRADIARALRRGARRRAGALRTLPARRTSATASAPRSCRASPPSSRAAAPPGWSRGTPRAAPLRRRAVATAPRARSRARARARSTRCSPTPPRARACRRGRRCASTPRRRRSSSAPPPTPAARRSTPKRGHLHHRPQHQLHERLRHALQVLQLLPPAHPQDRGLRAVARGARQEVPGDGRPGRRADPAAGRPQPRTCRSPGTKSSSAG